MSTAVYVYSVPVDRLRAAPGSKDKKLLAAARTLKGFFETIDEIAEDLDGDEEETPPKCATAYRQIVNGEPCDEDFGYLYGYAYEGLCTALGAETDRSWTQVAGSYDWFQEIDKALAVLRIKLKVTDLLYRGPLIDIPRPDDFPALGWWTADEVTAAAAAFKGLDLNKLDQKTKKAVKRVADAVEDIRSWIVLAAGRPGDWLVGVQS
jgi:hypothetical protein